MILEDPDEARAWGVLFALSLRGDGTISGRVTLNKTLALLQRDGFPIENKFITKDRGPYDRLIHLDAEDLEKQKLLEINEKTTKRERPTTIYHLRDEGLGEVHRRYSARIESMPYQRIFRAHLEEIKRRFSEYTTPEIVDKVHHELLMDIDEDDAHREMDDLVTDLMVAQDEAETDRNRTCFICLNLLGSLDFAVTSLSQAVKRTHNTNSSSKNLIYFNAKESLYWAQKLMRHEHVRYSRPGEGPLAGFREQLGYRLFCTEGLSGRYEIVKPIRDELSLKQYIETVPI
ncbi:MAG: hypothetical protein MUO81_07695 [Thermoplasmata archaeon]|nr:hypothetical protein [Thermoplasmata archaeon]